ncbi:superoxide dismutase [Aureimonas psammosilenae]|uniref:superoxide dismutase n=1 Tax=Aureimonas psammosilenae TaxID=2495496 RepID=UPI001260CEDE|nr:superoxide dismutase [Aureimonas psammosilenae]
MPIDRRTLLAAGGAVAAAGLVRPASAQTPKSFEQPKLPYAEDALAPTISARTVALHYGKHHKAYFDKLNQLTENSPYREMTLDQVVVESAKKNDTAIFNQAGQAWNHVFYWNQFAGGPAAPEGRLQEAVTRDFGGMDGLKKAMLAGADKVFGTGWVWLAADGQGKLEVLSLQDAGNPPAEGKVPLVGIDVWEHAYYLDYENRRPAHVEAVLDKLVNWRFVGEQLKA